MSTLAINTISARDGGQANLFEQMGSSSLLLYDQSVPSITTSLNVSSVTDVTTGDFVQYYTNTYETAQSKKHGNGAGAHTASSASQLIALSATTSNADRWLTENNVSGVANDRENSIATGGTLA